MSGRHPWNKLFEETFSPEQRARIIRDADKLVADDRQRRRDTPQASRTSPPRPVATARQATADRSR